MELCSVLRASLDGRGVWERRDTRMCLAQSLRYSPETIPTLFIGYTPTQNKTFKKKKFFQKKNSKNIKNKTWLLFELKAKRKKKSSPENTYLKTYSAIFSPQSTEGLIRFLF